MMFVHRNVSYGFLVLENSFHVHDHYFLFKKIYKLSRSRTFFVSPAFICISKNVHCIHSKIFQILEYTKTNLHLSNTRQDFVNHTIRYRSKLDIPDH